MTPKSAVHYLLQQNYYFNHTYHRLRLGLEGQRSNDKIVIYQMGKVGSTTVWKSLQALRLSAPIYHIHTLDRDKIRQYIARDKAQFPKLRFMYAETVQSEYLRRQLDVGTPSPWKVITLVRDPIAKTLSVFFQRLQDELFLGFDYRKRVKTEGEATVLKEIINRFYQEYIDNPKAMHPFLWFNHEMHQNLNFDVFSSAPFAEKDYCIYEAATAKILLLKLERLNASYQTAFQDFLDIRDLTLVRSNVGEEKRYKKLYKRFLQEVSLPERYLDAIYQTDWVRHFYTDHEIQQFYQHWQTR